MAIFHRYSKSALEGVILCSDSANQMLWCIPAAYTYATTICILDSIQEPIYIPQPYAIKKTKPWALFVQMKILLLFILFLVPEQIARSIGNTKGYFTNFLLGFFYTRIFLHKDIFYFIYILLTRHFFSIHSFGQITFIKTWLCNGHTMLFSLHTWLYLLLIYVYFYF